MTGEDSDEILRTARGAQRREAYQEVEASMRRSLEGFRRDLAAHPYVRELERRGPSTVAQGRPALQLRMSRGARIAWAAGSIAAALLLIGGWLVGRGNSSPPT